LISKHRWIARRATSLLIVCALLLAGPSAVADAVSDEWALVDEANARIQALVPGWVLPPAVTEPLAAGDAEKALRAARVALQWVEAAFQAEQDLPRIEAMSRTQPAFEGAQSLEDLETGAALAQDWRDAASRVRLAIERAYEPRDMLPTIDLWGVSIDPRLEAAIEAAEAGEVQAAIDLSNQIIAESDGAAGAGSLRVAGIALLIFAAIIVVALWRSRPPAIGRGGPPRATSG
jgi:hypothetical protein